MEKDILDKLNLFHRKISKYATGNYGFPEIS